LAVEVWPSREFEMFLRDLSEGEANLVILTSSTGVAAMIDLARWAMKKEDFLKLLRHARLVAVGPLTARAMEKEGMKVSLIPEVFSSDGLVNALPYSEVEGKKVYVLRSDHGEGSLISGLEENGASVVEVIVYKLVPQLDSSEIKFLAREAMSGRIDAFAFTSSLSAAEPPRERR
jgi:uroporphyrinogen-III synthase